MTLIEALKTGRRIRNLHYLGYGQWFLCDSGNVYPHYSILDDRWEVEPDPREEKKNKLDRIVKDAFNRHSTEDRIFLPIYIDDLKFLTDELKKAWGEE